MYRKRYTKCSSETSNMLTNLTSHDHLSKWSGFTQKNFLSELVQCQHKSADLRSKKQKTGCCATTGNSKEKNKLSASQFTRPIQ